MTRRPPPGWPSAPPSASFGAPSVTAEHDEARTTLPSPTEIRSGETSESGADPAMVATVSKAVQTGRRLVAARDVFVGGGDTAAASFFQVLIVELAPTADAEWARLALLVADAAHALQSSHFVGLAQRLITKAMTIGSTDTRLERSLTDLARVRPRPAPALGANGRHADQRWDGTPRGLLLSIGAQSDDPWVAWCELLDERDRVVVVEALAGHPESRRFAEFLERCRNHPDAAVRHAAASTGDASSAN